MYLFTASPDEWLVEGSSDMLLDEGSQDGLLVELLAERSTSSDGLLIKG